MVSPSKKRKDRKGRENGENSLASQTRAKPSSSKKSSKSLKPLTAKKFYLDIKNSAVQQKLESKLKTLGAVIEQFLVKEVNYVVTDRKDSQLASAGCSTPVYSTSPSPSPSPSPSVGVSSPIDGLGQKKSRTRAEAMLERVQLPQTVRLSVDPLDKARAWNIPVYSIQEILQRLEKLCVRAGSSSKPTALGLKVLHQPFLKLETGRQRRPEFRQWREWPSLYPNGRRGECPFNRIQDVHKRMTRKASKDGSERLAGGYCEMCCVDFPDLKIHVNSAEHVKLASNPDYYAQLDNLINAKTVNSFLSQQMCAGLTAAAGERRCLRSGSAESAAGVMGARSSSLFYNGHARTRASTRSLDDSFTKPLEVQCNGIVNHNHLTRSAVKSDSVLLREPYLEYEGISRRTRTFSASCPGTKNELSLSQLSPTGSDITHHLRSRKQMWLPTSLLGTTAEDALSNSRLRMNRDYPIAEALKSPIMPVINDKLKTGKEDEDKLSSKSINDCNNVDGSEHNSGDEEEDVDLEDRRSSKTSDSSKSKEKSECQVSSLKKKVKRKIPRELANLSYEDNRRKVQKKRLSVEEKLIEDNKTYYKVEVLNSKLRSTGYYISQSQRELEMSKANGNDGCVSQNSSEPTKPDVKSEGKEPVVVRFKKVRKTELSLLSDEAESFMFGESSKRESSVSTESSEEDDEVSLKMESEDHDRIGTRIKKEVMDESSMGSSSITSSSTCSRRKKKSADESVLHDNVDYYKFEPINSRLRFPNNLSSPENKDIKVESPYELRSENKNSLKVKLDESDFEPEKFLEEEKPPKEKCKYSYESLEFLFERVPTHEPWYQTFKRQDDCSEFYYPSYSAYPKILLPYEYPNSVMKRFKVSAISTKKMKRKKRTKIEIVKQLIQDDKPRKSPRCHASTLAIMSSLKRRRLRDSPDKKSELPSSELSISTTAEILVQDEESRCSTILDPPSVAPSDTPLSIINNSIKIPEIKLDSKAEALVEAKKHDAEIKETEQKIDTLFTEIFSKDNDDVLAHLVLAIKKEVDSCPAKEVPKKGKCKNKSTPNKEAPRHDLNLDEVSTCLPVDPDIFDEDLVDSSYIPGPSVDVMNLIEGYRGCSSMERADYEHMNPHAVDALRVLIADSCNSSDCGGSSACDFSFLEDGSRVSKKRKKKKRNMTGWPAKKRFSKKMEELSTVVLRRNCRAVDKLSTSQNSTKETQDELPCDKTEDSEVNRKLKDESSALLAERLMESEDGEVTVDSVVSDTKAMGTISRTNSIDSSSIKSVDQVQPCYIKVKKMTDECVDSVGRCLRTRVSETSPPSRRGNSRQAKVVGRESLRRCR